MTPPLTTDDFGTGVAESDAIVGVYADLLMKSLMSFCGKELSAGNRTPMQSSSVLSFSAHWVLRRSSVSSAPETLMGSGIADVIVLLTDIR